MAPFPTQTQHSTSRYAAQHAARPRSDPRSKRAAGGMPSADRHFAELERARLEKRPAFDALPYRVVKNSIITKERKRYFRMSSAGCLQEFRGGGTPDDSSASGSWVNVPQTEIACCYYTPGGKVYDKTGRLLGWLPINSSAKNLDGKQFIHTYGTFRGTDGRRTIYDGREMKLNGRSVIMYIGDPPGMRRIYEPVEKEVLIDKGNYFRAVRTRAYQVRYVPETEYRQKQEFTAEEIRKKGERRSDGFIYMTDEQGGCAIRFKEVTFQYDSDSDPRIEYHAQRMIFQTTNWYGKDGSPTHAKVGWTDDDSLSVRYTGSGSSKGPGYGDLAGSGPLPLGPAGEAANGLLPGLDRNTRSIAGALPGTLPFGPPPIEDIEQPPSILPDIGTPSLPLQPSSSELPPVETSPPAKPQRIARAQTPAPQHIPIPAPIDKQAPAGPKPPEENPPDAEDVKIAGPSDPFKDPPMPEDERRIASSPEGTPGQSVDPVEWPDVEPPDIEPPKETRVAKVTLPPPPVPPRQPEKKKPLTPKQQQADTALTLRAIAASDDMSMLAEHAEQLLPGLAQGPVPAGAPMPAGAPLLPNRGPKLPLQAWNSYHQVFQDCFIASQRSLAALQQQYPAEDPVIKRGERLHEIISNGYEQFNQTGPTLDAAAALESFRSTEINLYQETADHLTGLPVSTAQTFSDLAEFSNALPLKEGSLYRIWTFIEDGRIIPVGELQNPAPTPWVERLEQEQEKRGWSFPDLLPFGR